MKHPKRATPPTRARASAPPVSPLRSVADVAELLDVHPRTVRRLIAAGGLTAHRIGGVVRVSDHDLRAYLDRCR